MRRACERSRDKDGKLIGFEVLNYLSADAAKDVTVLPVESDPGLSGDDERSAMDRCNYINYTRCNG